jgi:hypothetical protein
MNAKSKIFGLLAAIALSISMFSGVAAQTSDSEWTSAELSDPGMNICTVDIIGAQGNFGLWEFDGSQYVPQTSTTMGFLTNIYGGGMAGCDVSVYFDGLYGPGGWIDPYYFTAYSDFRMDFVDPWWFGDTVPSGLNGPNESWYDFSYTLNSVPNLTPGFYEGGLYVYVSNAI